MKTPKGKPGTKQRLEDVETAEEETERGCKSSATAVSGKEQLRNEKWNEVIGATVVRRQ